MNWFDMISNYYSKGLWTKEQVKKAVEHKKISEEEYKKITGEDYII